MDAPRLRSLLLRGSVIAAANWPVVIAQAIAESVVKALAGIPLAGAAVLLLLLSVPDALPEGPGPARCATAPASVLAALATVPAALAGVAVVGAGRRPRRDRLRRRDQGRHGDGDRGRRGAGAAAPAGPLRVADLAAAHAWSRARFMDGCPRFGPRFVRLGSPSRSLEGAVALGYASAVVQAYRGFVSLAASWWIAPVVLGVSVVALADLDRAPSSSTGSPSWRWSSTTSASATRCARPSPSCGGTRWSWRASVLAALLLSTLAFVVTLIAAAAFGLVSFVPVAGVAVLPLQAAVWVVRGLMLPFIELAALAAYAAVYRRRPAASGLVSLAAGGRASAGAVVAAGAFAGCSAPAPPSRRRLRHRHRRPRQAVTGVAGGSKARRAACSSPCWVTSTTPSSKSVGAAATSGPADSVSSEMPPPSARQRHGVEALVGAGAADRGRGRVGAKPVTSTLAPAITGPPAGRNEQLLAPGLGAAADLEGPHRLVEHHRDHAILVDGQADGRRPECESASAPAPLRASRA